MKEYIEKEKLFDCLDIKNALGGHYGISLTAINAIPAADVRPVVRGHKVTHNRPIAGYWASGKLDGGWDGMEGRVWVESIMNNPVDYCSECGKRLDDTFQNYCPNCGAKMDGGVNDD